MLLVHPMSRKVFLEVCEQKSDNIGRNAREATPFFKRGHLRYALWNGIGTQSHSAQPAPSLPDSTLQYSKLPSLLLRRTMRYFLVLFSSRNRILPRFWCITSRPRSLGWLVPDHFQFFQCSAAGGDTEHVHLSYPESV